MKSIFKFAVLMVVFIFCISIRLGAQGKDYHFDGRITRTVLENYLSRAMTLAEFLAVDPYCNDGTYPCKERDIELIKKTGAKFIGRSVYRWGKEEILNDPDFLCKAKELIDEVHEFDPDIIFQACAFEAVYPGVNRLKIPEWVFEALGLPCENRCFNYDDMLDPGGMFVRVWAHRGSVPDITRTESQLWLMFLIGTYVDIGIEAIHLGQVSLMGMNDPQFRNWADFMKKVRKYVNSKARRNYILFDAHTPTGGMIVDGVSILDFNSFPLRIKETPACFMHAQLEVGYLDSMYGRSKGCVTPSGWSCESLPYLVEFDNFGISKHPDVAADDHFIWGYDEISWFYLLDSSYKKKWLRYAYDWMKENDPNAHLQMPGARIVTRGKGLPGINCRAISPSEECPYGMDIEDTIIDIWRSERY